jgi:hypothetical protein
MHQVTSVFSFLLLLGLSFLLVVSSLFPLTSSINPSVSVNHLILFPSSSLDYFTLFLFHSSFSISSFDQRRNFLLPSHSFDFFFLDSPFMPFLSSLFFVLEYFSSHISLVTTFLFLHFFVSTFSFSSFLVPPTYQFSSAVFFLLFFSPLYLPPISISLLTYFTSFWMLSFSCRFSPFPFLHSTNPF